MEPLRCLKCKTYTSTINIHAIKSQGDQKMIAGTCSVCGRIKMKFVTKEVADKY